MCVKAQTYSNKENYVPLYKFNWKETKSLQVPFRFLRLEVMWNRSRTLNRFHSVIYGKYGASHQSTTKQTRSVQQGMWSRPQDKEKNVFITQEICTFLWRLFKFPLTFLLPAYSVFLFAQCCFFLFIKNHFFVFHFEEFAFLFCFSFRRQSGVNLQVCFVNDSSSDKDSDAEDSRTETSLDTPLSPVVWNTLLFCVFVFQSRFPCFCYVRAVCLFHLKPLLSRVSRALPYRTETRRRRTRTRWMTVAGSGGCRGGCRRKPVWRWLWLGLWRACRWRWRGRSRCTDARLLLIWLVSHKKLKNFYLHKKLFLSSSIKKNNPNSQSQKNCQNYIKQTTMGQIRKYKNIWNMVQINTRFQLTNSDN